MPDSPSGVYTLPPSYKVANGDLTDASQHNPPFEDVQQALSNRLHRDGRTAWTGNQNANNKKIVNLADGTNPQDAATVAQAVPGVGDHLDTHRNPGSKWLRRDGSVYSSDDYPDLAPLMDPVSGSFIFSAATSGTSSRLNAIAAGNGRYIAVGNGGLMLSSTDKATWTAITSGTSEDIYSIKFANLTFVATLGNGKILTSATGESGSWTERSVSAPSDTAALDAAYGNGLWVVVGGNTAVANSGFARYSADLSTWSSASIGTVGARLTATFSNSRFVIGGAGGTVQYSEYGTSWSSATIGTGGQAETFVYSANGQLYACVAGAIYYTTNPSSWSTSASVPVGSICYGMAYGVGGYLLAFPGGTVLSTDDFTSWTFQAPGVSTALNSVITATDSGFILAGDGGVILNARPASGSLFQVPNDEPTIGWIRALP